ncbi:MAG TPA: hypothetical protein VHS06_02625, partial [Chloroflexota bacterium]|nr:hypothetical protein [Chloroflexota bacterium]
MIAQAHESTDSLDIHPEMLLPELFERYPTTRQVFDRYGLSGCGGHGGPVESIRFFARAHGVDESSLLAELRHATHAPQPSTPLAAPSLADSIYRRFFVGGILIVLTFGATWGAWLLWQIAFSHSFLGANSIQDVNAHGHAQIYGWVGLFIMGFAYQAFPRIWHTRLPVPRLAVLVFSAMASGIILRCIGMELHGLSNTALPLALLGGFLEIAAVLTFAVHILSTFRASGARLEPYVGFVIVALISFFAMSLLDVWHTYTTMSAQRLMELLWYIATYQ